MKELKKGTIDQTRNHYMYLKQTDLLKKNNFMFFMFVIRKHRRKVVDKN